LLLVRKIGLPSQPELAMGAVTDGEQPTIIRNDDVVELSGVSAQEFEVVCRGGNTLRLNDDESTIWEIGPDPK